MVLVVKELRTQSSVAVKMCVKDRHRQMFDHGRSILG